MSVITTHCTVIYTIGAEQTAGAGAAPPRQRRKPAGGPVTERRNCVSSEKLPDSENRDSRCYCALTAGPEGCVHRAESPWREAPGSPADAEHVLTPALRTLCLA